MCHDMRKTRVEYREPAASQQGFLEGVGVSWKRWAS